MNGSEAANQKTKGMAIVLGGSSGMGKTVAQHLLQDGIEVLITGKDLGKLKTVVSELSRFGTVDGTVVDLYNEDSVTASWIRSVPKIAISHTCSTPLATSRHCHSWSINPTTTTAT
jgi:NADP-dependent 3-hydroxy acid dehydrogenase YdfG